MPWFTLRCWNHHRQKIVKLRPWIWESNIFSHIHLQARIFVFTSCLHVWEWENAHGIMRQKNPQTRVDILWIFMDFNRVLQIQSPSCTPAREFQQWHLTANGETVYYISENFTTTAPHPPPHPPTPLLLFWLPKLLGTLEYLLMLVDDAVVLLRLIMDPLLSYFLGFLIHQSLHFQFH